MKNTNVSGEIKSNRLFSLLCMIAISSIVSTSSFSKDAYQDPLVITPAPLAAPPSAPVEQQPMHKEIQPPKQQELEIISVKPIEVKPIEEEVIVYEKVEPTIKTSVSRKINSMDSELQSIKRQTAVLSDKLVVLREQDEANIEQYYNHVSFILAQLQAGTTPSNPILTRRIKEAEKKLEDLSKTINGYNDISRKAGDAAASALVLSQKAQAAFSIPGAVNEDHENLSILQDDISRTMVSIDRIGHTVTGDITRASRYERSERVNLRALSLAVEKGDLYGVGSSGTLGVSENAGVVQSKLDDGVVKKNQSIPSSWKPLLKVTFDKPNVSYEAPLYASVHEALLRRPSARFEIVAVYPSSQFNEKSTSSKTRAAELDRSAKQMRDSLSNMGLPPERVRISSRWGKARFGKIYLYLSE